MNRTGPRISELAHDREAVHIGWSDGRRSTFAAFWLMDNRPEGRLGGDGQRLFDIAELSDEVAIDRAALDPAGDLTVEFAPDRTRSRFPAAWLSAHALDPVSRAARRRSMRTWGREFERYLVRLDYDEIRAKDATLARFLTEVRDRGFALIGNVPRKPGTVLEVIDLFGYVRETNYGRLFDVISQDDPKNLAFTGMALGCHTDNPYRDPVPGLQLLHCLEAAAEGGESLVVDGFHAAERLKSAAPEDFALLTRYAVPFRYAEPAVALSSARPLIELDTEGEVIAVRYNNRSAAPFDLPEEIVVPFYAAYRRFGRLLHDPEALVGFRLAPGDLFIVDNRRVLHGRRGFSAGRRHLQGAYADKDSLLSRLSVLEASSTA
jgi:[2-(trimethylamino)ethyl]phosphonate dioxygenase